MEKKIFKNTPLLPLFLYLIATAILFYKGIFRPIYASDTISQSYIYLTFIKKFFLHHWSLPYWNPFSVMGYPFLVGSPNFAPIRAFFFILPTEFIDSYEYFFYAFIGAFFTYLLLLQYGFSKIISFMFGLVFLFIPANISYLSVGHVKIGVTGLIPGVLLMVNLGFKYKKIIYFVIIGLLLGLQAQNHPQVFYYFFIFFISYYGIKLFKEYKENGLSKILIKETLFLALIGVIAIGVSSPRTILLTSYTKHTMRGGVAGTGWAFATSWSEPFSELLKFFFPNFYGMAFGNYFGYRPFVATTHYFGIIVLFLIITGLIYKWKEIETKLAIIFAIFIMLYSVGMYFTPFYRFLFNFIWGINKFRNPPTIQLIISGIYLVYAAYGLEFLLNFKEKIKKKKYLKLVPGILVAIYIVALIMAISIMSTDNYKKHILWGPGNNNDIEKRIASSQIMSSELTSTRLNQLIKNNKIPNQRLKKAKFNILFETLSLFIIALLFLYFSVNKNNYKKTKNLFVISIFFMILTEAYYLDQKFIKSVPNFSEVNARTDTIRFLKNQQLNDESRFRILPIPVQIDNSSNKWMLFGIESAFGYVNTELKRHSEIFKHSDIIFSKGFLAVANIKYLVAKSKLKIDGFEEVFIGKRNIIYENKNVLPRYFTLSDYIIVKDEEQQMLLLKGDKIDLSQTIILDREPIEKELIKKAKNNIKPGSNVMIQKFETDRVILNVKAQNPCFLFSSDQYYDKWAVYVDNKRQELYRADYMFRAVFIPKGEHKVEFKYIDTFTYYIVWFIVFFLITTISIWAIIFIIKNKDTIYQKYYLSGIGVKDEK